MERKESKEKCNLKLSVLDFFPSLEEIDEDNEGIFLLFQNNDLTYNLGELIKNREELILPNMIPNQVIKVNLIKSSNLHASGLFTIKNGEQWVTFTYEHKKKNVNNLALSLIDCIKLKFSCQMDNFQAINMNMIGQDFQTTKNDSTLSNIISKPSPKKLYNNFTTKKKSGLNHNNIELESLQGEQNVKQNKKNLNNTATLCSNKNNHNPLAKSENFSDINPLSSYSGVVGKDFLIKDNNLANSNKNRQNKKSGKKNGDTSSELKKDIPGTVQTKKKYTSKFGDEMNREEKSKGNNISLNIINSNEREETTKPKLKRNKSKNLNEQVNRTNKIDKKTKNVVNTSSNYKNNNQNRQSKKIKKDLSSKNIQNNKEEINKNQNEDIDSLNINIENNNSNKRYENMINMKNEEELNITNKLINDNYDYIEKNNEPLVGQIPQDIDENEINNYTKKLEEFKLLYNDEYINNINEEEYTFEIELFLEKWIELINEYHLQFEEKELDYHILKSMCKKNLQLYNKICKLYKKFKSMKDEVMSSNDKIKLIKEGHDNNYITNLRTNKVEINLFRYLIEAENEKKLKEKKDELKKIIKNLGNKIKIKNFFNKNEKIRNWLQLNMENKEQDNVKDKTKKKNNNYTKIQKVDKSNKDKGNKNDKKKKNNINHSPVRGKYKNNKTVSDEKGKIK